MMCEYMVGRKGKMTHGWAGRWTDGQPCLEPGGAVSAPQAYDLAPSNLCQGLPSQATPGQPPDHTGLWQPGAHTCVHLCSALGGRAGCEGGDAALLHTSRTVCSSLRGGAVTSFSSVPPHMHVLLPWAGVLLLLGGQKCLPRESPSCLLPPLVSLGKFQRLQNYLGVWGRPHWL